MAIAFKYLEGIFESGILAPGQRVLDIGCSNLYRATSSDISALAAKFHVTDIDADSMAKRSAEKAAFAGELIDKIGARYDAIDFAVDYKTTKFDLNRDSLPRHFRKAFDLVMNFGTTEHVINQAHAFEVIHDAVKPGGHILHQLPTGGFFNHGYFLYTGRFFFDLAGYNKYEVVDFQISQGQPNDIMRNVRDYAGHFPVLAKAKAAAEPFMADTAFTVVYRKVKDKPFVYPMELSTSYSKS